MLTIAPAQVLLPLVSRETFGGDAVYGTALALLSVGGLAGGLVSMRWKPGRPGSAAITGLAVYGVVPVALAWPVSPGFVYACYVATGLGLEIFAVQWVVNLQREIPPERLARVTSVDWLAASVMTPLGLTLTGPAGAAIGRPALLAIGAVAGFAVPLATLLLRGMTRFQSDVAALDGDSTPEAATSLNYGHSP